MGLKIWAAGFWAASLCAAAIAVTALASVPAEAAQKKRVVARDAGDVVVVNRPRTRVIVQRRSFLDAGTEVLPGERKFNDYAFPPYYSPTSIIDNKGPFHRSPLPGPMEPGYSGW
jgi:hypothetical protein